jgi:hypothetical protein
VFFIAFYKTAAVNIDNHGQFFLGLGINQNHFFSGVVTVRDVLFCDYTLHFAFVLHTMRAYVNCDK